MSILKTLKKRIYHSIITDKTDKIANGIIKMKLTYLSKGALKLLADSIKYIEKNKIEGHIVEAGCALGGSSILIAKLKDKKRTFAIYDSFEMMPEPTDNDDKDVHERYNIIKNKESKGIKGDLYYGYEEDLLNKVKNNFKLFNIDASEENVTFIKGYYENTLNIDSPIAFAHIDCDWYGSVMISLQKITPYLSVGGLLIIDDYNYYSGCKKATDEYFSDKKDQFEFIEKERLVIKKIK